MLLILTNSSDATADYVCRRLAGEGIDYFRLDTDLCAGVLRLRLAEGRVTLLTEEAPLEPERIRDVWLRRPKPIQVPFNGDTGGSAHTRAEWSEALEGFLAEVPEQIWMNHPARNAIASHKIEQLTRARRMGLLTPETLVTQSENEAREFFYQCHGQVIVKPLAFGYIERSDANQDTILYTNRISESNLPDLAAVTRSPTLLQREIQKEQDIRVTIVDRDVHAVGLIAKHSDARQRVDIRRNNMSGVEYCSLEVPKDIRESLLSFHASYGLRFSAIDLAIDKHNNWIFFEINPNGQWAWTDLLGITDIAKSFIK